MHLGFAIHKSSSSPPLALEGLEAISNCSCRPCTPAAVAEPGGIWQRALLADRHDAQHPTVLLQHMLALGTTLQPLSAQASQRSPPLSLPGYAWLFCKPSTAEKERSDTSQGKELSLPQLTPRGPC